MEISDDICLNIYANYQFVFQNIPAKTCIKKIIPIQIPRTVMVSTRD